MVFNGHLRLVVVALALQSLTGSFNSALAIVARDLVLTPKEGLQINGKSIYYEEQPPQDMRAHKGNTTLPIPKRIWERTLKHVTYLTLFTDVTADAIRRNVSQLRDYHEFMQAPYFIIEPEPRYGSAQFGDIVTLATGRLEQLGDQSFRFIEGGCDYGYVQTCESSRIWAFWQVQKIRHRANTGDQRKYRYEMKFSVTPFKQPHHPSELITSHNNGDNAGVAAQAHAAPHKRKVNDSLGKHSRWRLQQNFIQKEDDYPQSFGRIVYNDERVDRFADRRNDGNDPARTPLSQSTFVHNLFQAPPTPSSRLNIGEYIKSNGFAPPFPPPTTASAKIELFPNIFNLGNFLSPTTFRPNYRMKFARPDVFHHEVPATRYQASGPIVGASDSKSATNGITHHFHHHFYMQPPHAPGDSASEEFFSQTPYEQIYYQSPTATTEAPVAPTKPQHLFPTLSTTHSQTISEDVTLVPLLSPSKSQIYGQTSIHEPLKTPLLIYAAPEEDSDLDKGINAGQYTQSKRPFIQSEQIDEQNVRYSEPDPLYLNQNEASGTSGIHVDNNTAQVETPKVHSIFQPEPQKATLEKQFEQAQDAIQQIDQKNTLSTTEDEQSLAGSQKRINEVKDTTDLDSLTSTAVKTNSTTILMVPTAMATTTTTIPTSTTSSNSAANFVSTSTSRTPLRALSRYKSSSATGSGLVNPTILKRITPGSNITNTTTTEQSVYKWKPKRRTVQAGTSDSKPKSSHRHEAKIVPPRTLTTSTPITTTTRTTTMPLMAKTEAGTLSLELSQQPAKEIYEVLTQKSVSKSVSIKVGDNGEEIPIIVDDIDADNELKQK